MKNFMHDASGVRQAEAHEIGQTNTPERIGVMADTHNILPPKVEEIFTNVEEIWHLGDVCESWILDALRGICDRVLAVRGNNDWDLSLPQNCELRRGRETFFLAHIIPDRPLVAYDWVLYGHTHVPHLEETGRPKYLNPGAVGRCNRGAPPSVALLHLMEGGRYRAEIVPL
ncbi:MAG: metallophosphatase family protein [Methylacidiphilales bacterium]|nr:metallophosphatase family protein [Candidatus Methylacidiphilales bacterium]